jgi:uncharacterized protein YifE (UPF0438 family)
VKNIVCDICKRTITSSIERNIDGKTMDVCSNCNNTLNKILSGKEIEVALNMNHEIQVCLGSDAAEAYNKYWSKYSIAQNAKAGEWKSMQLHAFLEQCAESFQKMCGCMQKVAYPFEIRMKFGDLYVVDGKNK